MLRSIRENRQIQSTERFFGTLATAFGVLTLLLSLLNLVGWILNVPLLLRFLAATPTMKPNTALCVAALGTMLLLEVSEKSKVRRSGFYACAFFVLTIGSLRIFEVAAGIDLRIDSFLTSLVRSSPTGPAYGLMALLTASCLVLMTLAYLFFLSRRPSLERIARGLLVCDGFVGLLILMGHLYQVQEFERLSFFSEVSVPTALALAFLSLGGLLAWPHQGFVAALARPTLGGLLTRRTIPWIIVFPIVLAWVRLLGQDLGFYGTGFGIMLVTLTNIFLYLWIVCRSAGMIDALEEQRRQATERVIRIVEAAPSGMIMVDQNGLISLANHQAEKDFGYSADGMLGQPIEMLIPIRFGDRHKIDRSAFLQRPETRAMGVGRDLYGRRRDGTEFPVEVALTPLKTGENVEVLSIVIDITERKKAELVVRESERRFRELADSMPQIVWISDNETTISYCNKQWFAFTGFGEGQIGPEYWAQVRHPEDGERVTSLWTEAMKSISTFEVECRFRSRHQMDYRWFLLRAVPICDATGAVQRWYGTCTDIETLKRTQANVTRFNAELEKKIAERTVELRDAIEDLESANKELDAFSYSVSHDLRAPLRAIDGFSKILMKDSESDLTGNAKECLQRICHNTKQMGDLVDDLLAFSRLGRHELSVRRTDMDSLAKRTFDELRGNDVRSIDFKISPLPTCQGDPMLLKQVWVNVLSNALKYTRTRENAVIEIGARFSEEDPGEAIYFVKDNGVGFDMRYADKLFGVFQRLHRAEDFEGTGVGLALVQRIIQRHGGRIWAESEIDHGAKFSFSLKGDLTP